MAGRPLKKATNGVHLNLGGQHRFKRRCQEGVLSGWWRLTHMTVKGVCGIRRCNHATFAQTPLRPLDIQFSATSVPKLSGSTEFCIQLTAKYALRFVAKLASA